VSAAGRTRAVVALCAAGALALFAIVSIPFTKLALGAGFFTFIAALVLPRRAARFRRPVIALLAISALASTVGFVRFTIIEAAPGIIQGGRARTAQHAVSRLREISFAQDAMRKNAHIDPDGDGIGSAGLLGELTGAVPLRGGARLEPPILSPQHYSQLDETREGPAALMAGYYFMVCLPTVGGGFSAKQGARFDEELSERRFVAYAWPAASGGPSDAFFIDEYENILVNENREGGAPIHAGQYFPPACDAVTTRKESWQPWRGKKPRSELPGDRP
jgi:hypothetical protein